MVTIYRRSSQHAQCAGGIMALQERPERPASDERGLALQFMTVVWRLLLNIKHVARLARLLRLGPFSEICQYNPRFAIKPFGHNYLARNLDARASLGCFIYHYRRMWSSFPERILKMIMHWDIPLFQTSEDGHRFSVDLGSSRPYDKEGELSLLLKVDSLIIFNLAFTIVPGWAIGSDVAETLLISRLQGERSNLQEVRLATKAMCNVRPRALLLAALQGVALALGVENIYAVSAKEQSSNCGGRDLSFQNSYDEFFTELGLKKDSTGFFSGHVPIAEKPLELVDPNNRRTARKKQAFKAQIQMACTQAISMASGHASDQADVDARVPSLFGEDHLVATDR